jgi:diketogulonate reductase-like aldo/keto reductase
MLYGTAWKKEKTAGLVETAIKAGFRGIDTACQPKHYNEPGVGEGIARAISAGVVTRSQLFIQTKFTSLSGQDPNNVPYNKDAPLSEQVRQSLEASLRNLQTSYLDSWVLHSPMKTFEKTMQVWVEFEKAVTEGTVKRLGISNCYDLGTLQKLFDASTVKPSFLQNRFYRESNYDREIRAFCQEKGIKYQTFWTLTANPDILASSQVKKIASSIGKTREQIWFSFILSQNAMFLTGTTSEKHMAEDLEVPSIELSRADVDSIAALIEE